MEIENLINGTKIPKDKIKYNEPMSKHTTFKIGGPAECFIEIDNIEDLKEVIKIAQNNDIKLTIIGNGSNVLVKDNGIKGITLNIRIKKVEIENLQNNITIKTQEDEKKLESKVNKESAQIQMTVGAGENLGKIAQICLKEGITGLEELAGIPGTIGGAVKMNAGAHNKEIKDIVKSVKCIDYNGNEKEFTKEQLEFGYRKSIFTKEKYIILEVVLELQRGNQEQIKEKMEKYMKYRKEKQPLEYPSAGSTFKRDAEFITARLIDEAGLKGYSIGDAKISTKHSGFIINKGNATANDVMELIKYVKNTVYEKFNKKIELEIEILED